MVGMGPLRALAPFAITLAAAGCRSPDPQKAMAVDQVETHWAVESTRGTTQYIAPVVRFRVTNRSGDRQGSVQATATFRRKGEEHQTWGSDFRQVSSRTEPLEPGQSRDLVLKSDARYHSEGPVEGMMSHHLFRDVSVELFLRVGSSPWSKFAATDVERRIGARGTQEVDPPSPPVPPSPPASASPSAGASPSPTAAAPSPGAR